MVNSPKAGICEAPKPAVLNECAKAVSVQLKENRRVFSLLWLL